jgi:hypothetical protein
MYHYKNIQGLKNKSCIVGKKSSDLFQCAAQIMYTQKNMEDFSMKRILFFIFLSSVPISIVAADGSKTETEKKDRAQELTDKAHATMNEKHPHVATATAYHTLAMLAALSSKQETSSEDLQHHPSIQAARRFLQEHPVPEEKFNESESLIGWLKYFKIL